MGSVILIAFTTHHTPSIIYNGTSWLNTGISAVKSCDEVVYALRRM
jgi:hypothetical protein